MRPSIAQRLRDASAALPPDRVTMQMLLQAHGPQAQGSVLLLLAVPCLLPVPGVGTVLGLAMVALAVAMWRGESMSCLPQRVRDMELPRHWAQRVLGMLACAYGLAGRCARQRLEGIAGARSDTLVALAVGAMAWLIVLPIPFGNVLPALALMFIGLGLVFRDGLAVLLGLLMSSLALTVMLALLLALGMWGADWLLAGSRAAA